jgi:hypothetical protein
VSADEGGQAGWGPRIPDIARGDAEEGQGPRGPCLSWGAGAAGITAPALADVHLPKASKGRRCRGCCWHPGDNLQLLWPQPGAAGLG